MPAPEFGLPESGAWVGAGALPLPGVTPPLEEPAPGPVPCPGGLAAPLFSLGAGVRGLSLEASVGAGVSELGEPLLDALEL